MIDNHYLDILIETSSVVLGIENKINASLYTDLFIYSNLIQHRAEKEIQPVKILLDTYFNVRFIPYVQVLLLTTTTKVIATMKIKLFS
jgi:hypothetical protein